MTAEKLFMILLNRSISACWLVLAIIILRPFLRRVSRSLCCALWGLVAFRLICPFSLPSVFSLIPSSAPVVPDLDTIQNPAFDGIFPIGDGIVELTPAPSVVDPAAVSHGLTLTQAVTWLWLAGFVLLMLHALLSSLRLYVRIRDAVKHEDGYWLCDWVNFPFVFGVFCPRIIIPFNVDARDIPYILAHERAHLARHDHWRKPIAYLLLSVFWFQPVFWIAYYLLRRDVEFACDERALSMLGSGRECKSGYARALLGSRSERSYVAKLSSPLAFGGLQVKRRITSVLAYKKPTAVRMIAGLLVCALVAVCFVTDPKVEASAFEDASSPEAPSNDGLLSSDESFVGEVLPVDKPSAEEPTVSASEPTVTPAESPVQLPSFDVSTDEDESTWYISSIFQVFVDELDYDPYYIWNWVVNAVEKRNRNPEVDINLVIDIDVDLYLETGIMVKK